MAKLFYTLEETAEKLGKDEASITELVSQGKLREFRDHDNKLMFKVQDVDLLSGDSAGSMELDLSDSEPAAAGSLSERSSSMLPAESPESRSTSWTLNISLLSWSRNSRSLPCDTSSVIDASSLPSFSAVSSSV